MNFQLGFFLLILLITASPVQAECPKNYEQQERASIKAYYHSQFTQVNQRRDEAIRDALERYRHEYYPQAKELLEEYSQDRAALSERIRTEESLKGKQEFYNKEAREIGREYHQDIRILRKDSSGKYWAEISSIREEARESRQELSIMKAEDIASLNQQISEGCRDKRTLLRRAFEGAADLINKDMAPEDEAPKVSPGGPGIRG